MDSLLPSTREKAVPAAAGSGAPGATGSPLARTPRDAIRQ
jgi:hypothetical protein